MRYFSMQGNDGDVAAKDESQASIAQLAGYAAGISLLTFSHSPAYLYSIFFASVPLHLTMTVYMMRNATFELLTLPRISHLAEAYVAEGTVDSVEGMDSKGATGLFGEFYKTKSDCWLTLAPRVGEALSAGSEVDRSRWEVCSQVFQVSLFQSTICAERAYSRRSLSHSTNATFCSLVTHHEVLGSRSSSIQTRRPKTCFARSCMLPWCGVCCRRAPLGQAPSRPCAQSSLTLTSGRIMTSLRSSGRSNSASGGRTNSVSQILETALRGHHRPWTTIFEVALYSVVGCPIAWASMARSMRAAGSVHLLHRHLRFTRCSRLPRSLPT